MTDDVDTVPEREEIEMLLPWYVMGKLDRDDTVRVEAFLARHPEMTHQLALVREEAEQTVFGNEALPWPSRRATERLLTEVGASAAAPTWRGWVGKLSAFLDAPPAGALRWAAAAALAVVIAQSVTIGALLTSRDGPVYETASGRTAPGVVDGTFALVRFADAATAKTIADTLAGLDATIVDGPKPGGLFRVRLGPTAMAPADRDRSIGLLRQRSDVVALVLPAQ